MIRVEARKEFTAWAEKACNHVYPLSIVENRQYGDIFVDDDTDPHTVLFWHYCGFAYLTGEVSDRILEEITEEIAVKHDRRMILITDDDSVVSYMDKKGCSIFKRIEYEHAGMPCCDKQYSFDIKKIEADNIHSITGRIVPSFSWEEEQFLQNGFGYIAEMDGRYCGVAFSAAVSSDEVDIGVEVDQSCRGQGMASALALKMCEEIINSGKKPVWAHAESNTGSMRTALKCGFVQKKINWSCCIR
jgi:predicted GNAT family acetyltransferase